MGSTQSMALDQVVAYRAMAALYRAGVSIVRALEILSSQTEHPRLRKAFVGLVRYIGSGMSVAAAMTLYPRVFPELYIHLIEVGEASGNMEIMLERLALHAEKSNGAAMKLKSALVYPTFVFILCMLLLIFAPAFVFKGIFDMLISLHVELPPITKGMIFVSDMMNSRWAFVVFGAIFGGGYLFLERVRTDIKLRKLVQRILLKIPVLGNAVRMAEVASFARTLATLYSAGVPILLALELGGKASSNLILKDHAKDIHTDVANGISLHDAMQMTGFFPSMMIHLVAVGDETGALDRMLERAAEVGEEIVERALEAATAALEPLVLLMVGIVVGIVVIGTMMPLLKVVQTL
ncbi:MAG TPA: type II secretion system F family protein [Candidatus Xenobia bacterium]